MKVSRLETDSEEDGSTKVTVWCECRTPEDIEDLIAWLRLAGGMLRQWKGKRRKRVADSGNVKQLVRK